MQCYTLVEAERQGTGLQYYELVPGHYEGQIAQLNAILTGLELSPELFERLKMIPSSRFIEHLPRALHNCRHAVEVFALYCVDMLA